LRHPGNTVEVISTL